MNTIVNVIAIGTIEGINKLTTRCRRHPRKLCYFYFRCVATVSGSHFFKSFGSHRDLTYITQIGDQNDVQICSCRNPQPGKRRYQESDKCSGQSEKVVSISETSEMYIGRVLYHWLWSGTFFVHSCWKLTSLHCFYGHFDLLKVIRSGVYTRVLLHVVWQQ